MVHVGSPRAMLVLREAIRAEDQQVQVHHNQSTGQCRLYYAQVYEVRVQRRMDERQFHKPLPFTTWDGGAPLTENCLKSPSGEHGQAVLTSEAARTSLVYRLHTNSQDRATGMAINRHLTDARTEPALSLIATGGVRRRKAAP